MTIDHIIGVDLGQAHDYTALAVLERSTPPALPPRITLNEWGREVRTPPPPVVSTYQVRHLERLPLGTPYPEQVKQVKALYEAVSKLRNGSSSPALVVDQTGVGRPVVDMLRAAGHRDLNAVTIHGGDSMTRDGRDYRVPKRELVSVLQVLLQSKRLQVAASLEHAVTLVEELQAFKVTISRAGHDSYSNDWREAAHDDMVLAVALAAWQGEQPRRGLPRIPSTVTFHSF